MAGNISLINRLATQHVRNFIGRHLPVCRLASAPSSSLAVLKDKSENQCSLQRINFKSHAKLERFVLRISSLSGVRNFSMLGYEQQVDSAYSFSDSSSTGGAIGKVAGIALFLALSYAYSKLGIQLPTEEDHREPGFTQSEVDQMIKDGRKLLIYKGRIADVTDFIEIHPGGAGQIEQFIGKEIDGCWAQLPQHILAHADEMFDAMCIGHIINYQSKESSSPFRNNPSIGSEKKVHSFAPTNAEAKPDSKEPFIRDHLPVPPLDPSTYRLKVEFEGKSISLSYQDIVESLYKVSYRAAHACAGNLRKQMVDTSKEKLGDKSLKMSRIMWSGGAYTNLELTGTQLIPFLADKLGVSKEEIRGLQLKVFGADIKPNGEGYGTSFTLVNDDTIFAYEMNGVPMTDESTFHYGFGVGRLFDPLAAGNRQIKGPVQFKLSHPESISIDPKWASLDPDLARTLSEAVDSQSYRQVDAVTGELYGAALLLQRTAFVRNAEYEPNGDLCIRINGYTNDPNGLNRILVRINRGEKQDWMIIEPDYSQPKGKRYEGIDQEIIIPASQLSGTGNDLIECYADDSLNGKQPVIGRFNTNGVGWDGRHVVYVSDFNNF